MDKLIPTNIYRITYRIKLGKAQQPFIGEYVHKSMLKEKEINFSEILQKNIKQWGKSAQYAGIILIQKIGEE